MLVFVPHSFSHAGHPSLAGTPPFLPAHRTTPRTSLCTRLKYPSAPTTTLARTSSPASKPDPTPSPRVPPARLWPPGCHRHHCCCSCLSRCCCCLLSCRRRPGALQTAGGNDTARRAGRRRRRRCCCCCCCCCCAAVAVRPLSTVQCLATQELRVVRHEPCARQANAHAASRCLLVVFPGTQSPFRDPFTSKISDHITTRAADSRPPATRAARTFLHVLLKQVHTCFSPATHTSNATDNLAPRPTLSLMSSQT